MTDARSPATNSDDFGQYGYLHTMLRVYDLEASKDFYTRLLGMRLLREREVPSGEFTLAFLGYGAESSHTVLELTYNWNPPSRYDLGNGFGHIAIGVPDAYRACARLEAEGVRITRSAGPMQFGGPVIAFIEDPDGYKIELIQRDTWQNEAPMP